jgi:hypothetical protein
MSNVKISLIVAIVIFVAGALWYALSPLFMKTVANDPVPMAAVQSTDRPAVPADKVTPAVQPESVPVAVMPTAAHPASGTARVVQDGANAYLRYENYKTINGPDLRVYLATDIEATDFVDLGELKATEGNVNYPIPAGTDLAKYRYALTWCEDFSVLFNSAELLQK